MIPQGIYVFTNDYSYMIPTYPVKVLTYYYFDLEITPKVDIENINSPVEISLDENNNFIIKIKRTGIGKNILENIRLIFNINNPNNIQIDNANNLTIADYDIVLITTENGEDNAIDSIINNVSSSTDTGITATFTDDTWTIDFGEEITQKLLNNTSSDRDIDFVISLGNTFYPMNNRVYAQMMTLNPDPNADTINFKPYTFNYHLSQKQSETEDKPSGLLFSTTDGPSRPTVTEASDIDKKINWEANSTSTATTTVKEVNTDNIATSTNLVATSSKENIATITTVADSSTTNQGISGSSQIKQIFFSENINYRSTNLDVKSLQKFLNQQGFLVAQFGPGSLNQETNYNGPLTRQAIKKFQEAHPEILVQAGITTGVGTGYFGPYTRAYINKYLEE